MYSSSRVAMRRLWGGGPGGIRNLDHSFVVSTTIGVSAFYDDASVSSIVRPRLTEDSQADTTPA